MVRFRKSKKVGPLRFTVSKTGVSMSGGVPGARLSLNSKGEVRRTVGLPGTGIYDTKKIGGGGGRSKGEGGGSAPDPTGGHRVEAMVVVAAESRALLDGQSDVAYLPVVEVDDVPEIARLAGVGANPQGWVRGIREAVLMPQGDTYRVVILVSREDNPRLFGKKDSDSPKGIDIGRLGKRELTKWAPEFDGRMIQVVVYLDATPGLDARAEVRFHPALLEDDDEVQAAEQAQATEPVEAAVAPETPATPAGWYADPWNPAALRWFDGTAWTEHVAPGQGGSDS